MIYRPVPHRDMYRLWCNLDESPLTQHTSATDRKYAPSFRRRLAEQSRAMARRDDESYPKVWRGGLSFVASAK